MQHIEESHGDSSCCYIADGAESLQLDHLGQLLCSAPSNGQLKMKALDLNALKRKTSETQAAAFGSSLEEVADLKDGRKTMRCRR